MTLEKETPTLKGVEEVVAEFEQDLETYEDAGATQKFLDRKDWLSTTLLARDAAIVDQLKRYQELLLAVESKYEGETRHETALRYIKQAEQLPLPEAAKHGITNL